jgi:hypothetical protein
MQNGTAWLLFSLLLLFTEEIERSVNVIQQKFLRNVFPLQKSLEGVAEEVTH